MVSVQPAVLVLSHFISLPSIILEPWRGTWTKWSHWNNSSSWKSTLKMVAQFPGTLRLSRLLRMNFKVDYFFSNWTYMAAPHLSTGLPPAALKGSSESNQKQVSLKLHFSVAAAWLKLTKQPAWCGSISLCKQFQEVPPKLQYLTTSSLPWSRARACTWKNTCRVYTH